MVMTTVDKLSDGQVRVLLENAVNGISQLASIRATCALDAAKSGTPVTFDQYINLLVAEVTLLDRNNSLAPTQNRRQVFATEIDDDSDVDDTTHSTGSSRTPPIQWDVLSRVGSSEAVHAKGGCKLCPSLPDRPDGELEDAAADSLGGRLGHWLEVIKVRTTDSQLALLPSRIALDGN